MEGLQALILRPDLYHRDCDECHRMWYDDEGKPVIRQGVHLPRPCPPACHRCDKHRLGVKALTRGNRRLYDLYTDLQLGLVQAQDLEAGEREALRLMHRIIQRAERQRLAADMAEVMRGHS